MSRGGTLVLLTLTSLAGRAHGQDPAHRSGLAAFRDSIASVADTAALGRLAGQYESMLDSGAVAAMARVRGGYLRLQAGQPDLAAGDFKQAARLEPAWPAPWLGLAEAHYALGRRTWNNTMNLGTAPGLGQFKAAAQAYATALELDPRSVDAAEGELRLALERRDTAMLAVAVAHATVLPPDAATGSFLLSLSRAEWRLGDLPAAAAAIRATPSPRRTPAMEYQLARTLLAERDTAGDGPYWDAVASDDPDMLTVLRRDMALIATPEELAAFDSVSGGDRAGFLRQFWDIHAARDLRPASERMTEHYARVAYADEHFAFGEIRHMQDMDDVGGYPRDSTLDTRGTVYVRMGPPDIRRTPFVIGLVPNETWVYNRSSDSLLLTFAAQHSVNDQVLVASLEDIKDAMHLGQKADLYSQLSDVNDYYRRLLVAGPNTRLRYRNELRLQAQRSIAVATFTDSDELHFPDSVAAYLLPMAIGAFPGGSRVQLVVALVVPMDLPDREVDTLRLRFGAFDSLGRPIARLDSTISYAASIRKTRPDSSYIAFGRFEVALPAGTWEWKAAVQAGDSIGRVLAPHLMSVQAHDEGALSVSDLAIAGKAWSARWEVAVGDTAYLTPFGAHLASEPAELYYEVYGLPAGAPFHTDITARRGRKGVRPSMTLGFDDQSQGRMTRINRTLDLRSLAAGDYVLEVKVTNAIGQTAESERPFTVVKM